MSLLSFLKPIVEKFPNVANYYRYSRDSRILRSEVLYREKLGFFFNATSDMEEGVFEPDETNIFDKIIANYFSFILIC